VHEFVCWISNGTNTQSDYLKFIILQQQQMLRKHTTIFCYTYIGYLAVVFIENWTKTPVPAAHVNSWSDSLRSATCSGEPDYKVWIS